MSDTFNEKRKKLQKLSDQELKNRFWKLTEEIAKPMIDTAKEYTSPSIERSVLLRCGIASTTAGKIVELAFDKGILGLGAGNLVYRLSKKRGIEFVEAGNILAENKGWEDVRNGD